MNWQNISDGYEFKVYSNHSYAELTSINIIKCNLNEFDNIYQILSHLAQGISKHIKGSTDDVAAYIHSKTGTDINDIMRLIDPIVRSEINNEEHIVNISEIEVYRFEDGKVQKINL